MNICYTVFASDLARVIVYNHRGARGCAEAYAKRLAPAMRKTKRFTFAPFAGSNPARYLYADQAVLDGRKATMRARKRSI